MQIPSVSRRAVLGGSTAVVAAGAASALAGCSAQPGEPGASPTPTPTTPAPAKAPVITYSMASDLKAVDPQDTITVSVTDGVLAGIVVKTADGDKVPGTIKGGVFTPDVGFPVRQDFRAVITANDADGTPHTKDFRFSTVNPELVCEVTFRYSDVTPGNGMPLWVNFDMPIAEAQRAAIEKCCTVTTEPKQEGSFGWIDEHTLQWRPKEYWQPGSTAHIEVAAAGAPAEDTWVLANASADYTYGDLRVLAANIDNHTLSCYRNGELVQVLPVSMGKPGFETMTGTKLIMDKEYQVIMDSETFGVGHNEAEGYKLTVYYAMRITWSGEYFHAAPWADGSHGYANVSHGCTGMTTGNAEWLFNFAEIGDPAEFTGSTHRVQPWQTIGAWTYSWEDWKKLSAL